MFRSTLYLTAAGLAGRVIFVAFWIALGNAVGTDGLGAFTNMTSILVILNAFSTFGSNFSISWGRRPIDRHTTALAERPWCIPFAMEIEQNQGARAR